jgi:hypothetical protein
MASTSTHWLLRLDAESWIDAAANELDAARSAGARSRRKAVTHARRAAGMALNAVLRHAVDRGEPLESVQPVWGRSYIDHLRALAGDAPLLGCDPSTREACGALLAIAVVPAQGLVSLARDQDPTGRAADLASAILEAAKRTLPGD